MHYRISGEDTYSIKDTLKSCGCTWVPGEKEWRTPYLEDDELLFAKIKEICRFSSVKMIPEKLDPECQKIQEILNRIKE